MTTESVGSDAWLDAVFQARVKRELFAGHAPDQTAPVLVLLGGQPAAGKTRAQRAILSEHAADDLETARWLADYAAAFRKATARPGYLGSETAPTYLRLQDDAQRMIQARVFKPGSPVAIWHHEQTEQSARLRQVLPADIHPKRSVVRDDLPREEPTARGRPSGDSLEASDADLGGR